MMHFNHPIKIGGIKTASMVKKKNAAIMVCVAILSILVNACGNPVEKKETLLIDGKSYLSKGDYFMARMQFKQALQIDPGMTDAYYNLGITETQLGNIKQALSNFLRVLALTPNHPQTHIQIGQIMLDAGFPQEAIQRSDLALSIDEADPEALKLKAVSLLKLDKPQNQAGAASHIFEQLLREGKTSAEIYYYSAKALLLRNDPKSAQAKIAEGLAQNPDNPLLYELLARTHQHQGEKKNALRTYQKLITIAPANPDYLLELVELLWQENQKEEAQKILAQRMLTIGAKDESVWIRLSKFYARKNKPDLSLNTLIAGLSPHPGSFEIRLALAKMLVDKGAYVTAIKRLYPAMETTKTKPGFDIGAAQLLLSKSFLAVGDLTAAKQYADQYIKNYPQSQKAHFIIGLFHLLNNAPHSAISEFWSILAINPANTAARIQLAHAMTRTDQWRESVKILSAGLEKSPHSAALRYALFQIYLQMNAPAEAEAQLKALLSQNPNDIKVMVALSDFYKSTGAYEKASEGYGSIVRKRPKSTEAYIALSKIHIAENNPEKAIEQLEKGLIAIPESDEILTALAGLYIQTGKKASAIKTVKAKLAKTPQSSLGYVLLGDAYAALWEYGKTEDAYLKATSLAPDSSDAHMKLMELWYRRGEKEKITDYFHSLLTDKPNALGPRIALVNYYIEENNTAKASELFNLKVEINPQSWRDGVTWIRLICASHSPKKDSAQAVDLAKEILQHHPDNPPVLDILGWAYYHSGDLNRAQGYLFRALDLKPNLSIALYDLGKVSFDAGRHKTARYALNRVLAIDPEFPQKKEAQKMLSRLGHR